MKFFKRGAKQNTTAQSSHSKSSTQTQSSFILEPILTPSAGIDGTEAPPETAIAQLTPLPTVDLPQLDFELDAIDTSNLDGLSDSDDNLEPVEFIDSLADFSVDQNQDFDFGNFTVGTSGEVSIDFLFDGGGFQGELAIFSLDGMADLEPGSDAFIQEAARRALSSSTLGHVVVSDATDAARFSGSLAWEGDFNSGDYKGVQTFQMRPGDRLGFMLVPNNTVQAVFENPCNEGIRPLFSMATANPNDQFQAGQIADVTGDGNTFVFEDLRLDWSSDRDYNDVVFQVRGATGDAVHLDDVIDSNKDWRSSDMGTALTDYTKAYVNPLFEQISVVDEPEANQPLIGIIDTGFAAHNPDIDYSQLILGRDRVANDDNPLLQPGEDSEHGTHLLGIIGATQDNGIGIDGANNVAPIWLGRAVGSGQWAESLIEFVDAAKDSGQPNAVVNLSLDLTQINLDGAITTRYELTPVERAAIEYARQNKVLIVASAGNDGSVMSALGQASQEFDNIITVGAADGVNRASYSSFGYGLDILAPGGTESDGILSTVADGIGTMAGTSVATAKVTGAISQVWAVNPELSYRQIIEILKATAQDLVIPGFDLDTGAGLLNVAAAISIAKITKPEHYLSPEIDIPDTWSGEGFVIPSERAADASSTGFDLAKIIAAVPEHLRSYAHDSIPRILAEVQASGITDLGQIAYILATAQHESHLGRWMEELSSGSQYEGRTELGNTQRGDGPRFKGRGYVQITGRANYTDWSRRLRIDLVGQPQQAADRAIAAKILVQGMRDGTFTSRRLSHYINGATQDFINARRIVNGTNKATEIAQTARNYLNALTGTRESVQPPPAGRRPYSVRSGDTLWGIAQRDLGNGNRWREITKDIEGRQSFTDAEARMLRVNQTVYLPVVREVGTGLPIIPRPITPGPILVAPGSQSRSPQLFREAYERAGGRTRGWTPTGHAYPWGNGWTQEFRDPRGDRMLLMLEDDADKAYIMWGGNLVEYEFMGGPIGRNLDGRGVFLGYPMSDENIFSNPRDGQRSVWQQFRDGNGKARIHNLVGFASVATWGTIGILYTDMGGAGSFLGMPTRREYIDGDTIWADFQGGRIAHNRNDGRTEALRPGEQPSWRQNTNVYIRPGSSNLTFRRGQEWVTSSNYKFTFQNDGNLVLYNPQGKPIWATGTDRTSTDSFVVQADGNVVLYNGSKAVWATDTAGNPGAFFAIQGDGNLVVYASDGKPLASTGTQNGRVVTFTASADWLKKFEDGNGGGNNSSYLNELATWSDQQWNWAAGDNTRITGPMWSGEQDERNYSGQGAILQVYNDLSNKILGGTFRSSAGYVLDPSYRNDPAAGGTYGWHNGIDIDTPNQPTLTDVKALVGGNARIVQNIKGNYFLEVAGDDGRFYWYGHLSNLVKTSGRVNSGDIIGKLGGSNPSNHLHFQVNRTQYRPSGYNAFDQAKVYNWTLNPLKVFWQLKREGKV